MHGLLKNKFFLTTTVLAILILTIVVEKIRLTEVTSKRLQLVPFGYNYNEQPLTGIVYSFSGMRLTSLTFVWRGLRHGPDIQWYGNGQRFIERHYRYGVEYGVHKAWYQDGRVLSIKSFENGKAHGESFEWHSNGQPSQFIVYDHGTEIAAKSWTAGGKPFYNYVWRDGSRIGLEGDRFCSPIKKQF